MINVGLALVYLKGQDLSSLKYLKQCHVTLHVHPMLIIVSTHFMCIQYLKVYCWIHLTAVRCIQPSMRDAVLLSGGQRLCRYSHSFSWSRAQISSDKVIRGIQSTALVQTEELRRMSELDGFFLHTLQGQALAQTSQQTCSRDGLVMQDGFSTNTDIKISLLHLEEFV